MEPESHRREALPVWKHNLFLILKKKKGIFIITHTHTLTPFWPQWLHICILQTTAHQIILNGRQRSGGDSLQPNSSQTAGGSTLPPSESRGGVRQEAHTHPVVPQERLTLSGEETPPRLFTVFFMLLLKTNISDSLIINFLHFKKNNNWVSSPCLWSKRDIFN